MPLPDPPYNQVPQPIPSTIRVGESTLGNNDEVGDVFGAERGRFLLFV